jgi:hypothetical protein
VNENVEEAKKISDSDLPEGCIPVRSAGLYTFFRSADCDWKYAIGLKTKGSVGLETE